jgi:hypothetical protein
MSALANGVPLTFARLTIGRAGRVLVEAQAIDEVTAPGGSVAFAIGDMLWSCTLVPSRFGSFAGAWSGTAVGGRNGWGKIATKKGYQSPVGVLSTQVILDAAREAGELPPVVQIPLVIGQFYARRGDLPLGQVLSQRAPGTEWWIDEAGVTQVGIRPPSLVAVPFDLLDYRPDLGRATVATDNPSAFRPGASFTEPLIGTFRVNSVVWTSTPQSLRGEIWIG